MDSDVFQASPLDNPSESQGYRIRITVGGKVFTSIILFVGLGIIAVPAGLIASALTKTLHDENNEDD